MDKFYKKTILYLFVLALLIVLGSAVAFADNIPHEEYYGKCEVYVNDVKTKDIAYTCKGNIYISINSPTIPSTL